MLKKDSKEAEKRISDTLNYLKSSGFAPGEISRLVNNLLKVEAKEELKVPMSIFKNDYLSSLEAIVKYLRENLLLTFKQIGLLTNRSNVALAVSYRHAKRKMKAKFVEEASPYSLPVSILKDRKLSVLENIVSYIKDNFGLTYHNTAILLNRDDRTIWTVYQRALKKKKTKK